MPTILLVQRKMYHLLRTFSVYDTGYHVWLSPSGVNPQCRRPRYAHQQLRVLERLNKGKHLSRPLPLQD